MVGTKKSVLAYRLAQPALSTMPPVGVPMSTMPPPGAPVLAAYHPAAAPPIAVPHPAAAPPTGLPTLRLTHPNTKGPSVVYLQQKLGIGADGVFGSGTDRAVRAFQTAHGLTSDGIVGPATWAALG
jgi:peptidoglycan hydrolase-like protein with peptidoglycan-binding domain